MKTFFKKVSITTVLVFAGMPLYSATIDVLAQSYSISGAAWTFEPSPTFPPVVVLPFSSSGPSPVRLTDIYPSLNQPAFANTYAIGTTDPLTVFLNVAIAVRVVGQSVAQVTFHPGESGMLDLAIQSTDGGADAIWYLRLVDVTAGNTVFSSNSHGLISSSELDSIFVDSAHEYTLTDTAEGLLGDAASVATTLSMSAVPEVCSTTLLFAISLAGLVGLTKVCGGHPELASA
jgi:hypothetical protein